MPGVTMKTDARTKALPVEQTTAQHKELRAALQAWIDAVNTGVAETVAALYAADAVLLATFEPEPRITEQGRLAYLTAFKERNGFKARLDESHIEALGEDSGTASGLYTFISHDENGLKQIVPARFTFVYRRDEIGTWLIVSHHSSVLPQRPKRELGIPFDKVPDGL
jgi:uncharacterized protein (TIGR02246 family)